MTTTHELPEIDGLRPVGVVTKIKGTGERIDRACHLGERLVLLVEVEVDSAYRLTQTKEGPKLHQELRARDLFEVTDDEDVARILRNARAHARLEEDEAAGRIPLGFSDTSQPRVTVDGSGVLLTLGEVLELRGVELDDDDEVVVEFFPEKPGAKPIRAVWPTDWLGSGQDLAAPGGRMRPPGHEIGETLQVAKLLDVVTAEPIDEWTEHDEHERLEAEELAAEAEEAAEVSAGFVDDLRAQLAATGELDPDPADVLALGSRAAQKAIGEISSTLWLQLARILEGEGKARDAVLDRIDRRVKRLAAEEVLAADPDAGALDPEED